MSRRWARRPGRRGWWWRLGRLAIVLVGPVFIAALLFLGLLYLTTERVPDYGGRYVEGVAGAPMAINPLLFSYNEVDKDLVYLIFSGLTRLDERGEVVPDLAERWEISGGGNTYTFYLRPEVRWHDGATFTADDVVFTIQAIQDPDFQGFPDLARLWRKVKVEKVNDLAVRLTPEAPYAPFLSYTTLGILPAHTLKGVPAKELPNNLFNVRPIGTGPFMIKEVTLERAVLEANPSYFGGFPYLSEIEFRFYPDYPTALNALKEGKVQGMILPPGEAVPDLATWKGNKKPMVYQPPKSSFSLIFLNLQQPLFQDKRVRQALSYGLDRSTIVRSVLGGQGVPAYSPILPWSWAFDAPPAEQRYDPEKARQLLDEAGWKLDGGSVRKKDGQEFRFSLLTNNDERRIAVAQEVLGQFRQLGIKGELSASGTAGLLQNYLLPRRYDAVLYGWDTGYDPDLYPLWDSSQIKENGFNVSGFSQPDADKILEEARRTSDPKERKRLYGRFQTLFTQEVPSLLLYYPTYTYLVAKDVQGIRWGILFEPSSRFLTVSEWHVRTRLRTFWERPKL